MEESIWEHTDRFGVTLRCRDYERLQLAVRKKEQAVVKLFNDAFSFKCNEDICKTTN